MTAASGFFTGELTPDLYLIVDTIPDGLCEWWTDRWNRFRQPVRGVMLGTNTRAHR